MSLASEGSPTEADLEGRESPQHPPGDPPVPHGEGGLTGLPGQVAQGDGGAGVIQLGSGGGCRLARAREVAVEPGLRGRRQVLGGGRQGRLRQGRPAARRPGHRVVWHPHLQLPQQALQPLRLATEAVQEPEAFPLGLTGELGGDHHPCRAPREGLADPGEPWLE